MNEALCRPDEDHFCVECCKHRADEYQPCFLLGPLPDNTLGCLGHDNRKTIDGLTQEPLCQDFNCLAIKGINTPENRKTIKAAIKNLPQGEFQMTPVLKKVSLWQHS